MSEAADTEVIETAAPAEAAPEPAAALTEIESAAKAGGWTPKDEWKGDPDKWVDAPQFVLKAAEILPNVTKELREVKKTLKEFGEYNAKADERAYARALKEVQERHDAAVTAGDVSAAREAADDLVELKAAPAATMPPAANPDFDAWRTANPWFDADPEMQAITIAIAQKANEDGYTGKAQIAEVDRRIKARFPNLGKNPNRDLPGAVEGAGAARRPSGKTYSDLPAEAKAACDDFVKRIPGFTREKYTRDYFA